MKRREFIMLLRGARAMPNVRFCGRFWGVKRTWAIALHMSAFDPERTCVRLSGHRYWSLLKKHLRHILSDREEILWSFGRRLCHRSHY
jgi:hypothetical protein